MSKYFTFTQNNTGGSFEEDDNVDLYVIIEADNADEANYFAEEIGIYFDGVYDGYDCSCCGDRWYTVSESDGTPSPLVYGEYPDGATIIHYKDGTKTKIGSD